MMTEETLSLVVEDYEGDPSFTLPVDIFKTQQLAKWFIANIEAEERRVWEENNQKTPPHPSHSAESLEELFRNGQRKLRVVAIPFGSGFSETILHAFITWLQDNVWWSLQ